MSRFYGSLCRCLERFTCTVLGEQQIQQLSEGEMSGCACVARGPTFILTRD